MITIIASTNRKNSFTKKIANVYLSTFNKLNVNSQVFDFQILPSDFLFSCSYGNSTDEFDLLINKYFIKSEKYIFICPEYNGSIPGILKALIDCTDHKIFNTKKIAIVGVSSGHAGNLRGIDHLTSIFHHMGSEVLSIKPKLSNIQDSFKENIFINNDQLNTIENQVNLFINF